MPAASHNSRLAKILPLVSTEIRKRPAILLFQPDASDEASVNTTSTAAGPSSSAEARRSNASKNFFALWLVTRLVSSLVKVAEGDSDPGLLERSKEVIVEILHALVHVLVTENGLPVARCIVDQLLDLNQGS